MSRVAEGHFRRKRKAPLIFRGKHQNSGAIPGPKCEHGSALSVA